jgi:hypothetical protein
VGNPACLDDRLGPDRGDGEFVAFQVDFASYPLWDGWEVAVDPVGPTHLDGPRWVFANALPETGATSFPVGTILVKEARNGPSPDDWDIFAMVKRGGGFNPAGAIGWEWFELARVGDETIIDWRGDRPPALSGYECVSIDPTAPAGDCNACHGLSWENDYVNDGVLRLDALP